MNLTISGHHLEVTPALRSYVTTKLDRIMRHFDQVVDVKVLLTVEKQKETERRQRAECNMSKEVTCLPKAPMPTCMLLWMIWSTSSIAKWFVTRTVCKIITMRPPSA
jgi:hypothetical protein